MPQSWLLLILTALALLTTTFLGTILAVYFLEWTRAVQDRRNARAKAKAERTNSISIVIPIRKEKRR